MTDMTTTTDLVKRLEAGETGREIDAEVFAALGWIIAEDYLVGSDDPIVFVWHPSGLGGTHTPLKVTTSLDAALALVERVIPKCEWSIDKFDGDPVAHVDHPNDPHGMLGRRAQAPTPAAALIAALLKAEG